MQHQTRQHPVAMHKQNTVVTSAHDDSSKRQSRYLLLILLPHFFAFIWLMSVLIK